MKMFPRILMGLFIAGLFAMLFFGVFGRNGLRDLLALKRVEAFWVAENDRLEMENSDLGRQIERLKHDPAYIEHIARGELGMIGRDEIIVKIEPALKENP